MKKYLGMKWNQLTEKDQEELLRNSFATEAEGDCIIDLTEDLSVAGKVVVTEDEKYLEIDDESIIYNPAE